MTAIALKGPLEPAAEAALAREVERFVRSPRPGDFMGQNLAELLGCTLVDYLGSPGYRLTKPDPDTQYPANVPDCIERLLPVVTQCGSESQNVTSLLSAICRHGILEDMLHTEDSAYNFAKALLIFIETYDRDYPLASDTAKAVGKMLNKWIKPEVPWSKLPLIEEVNDALFGASWHLFYDRPAFDSAGDRFLLGTLVANVRPPFLPGLCQAQTAPQYTPLPGLS